MALSGLGGNGHRLPGRYRPMSEINVTPLVDVMLVLLVVFMVAAPLLTVGVPVNLPQTQAPPITEPKEPLIITINGEGRIFVQETEVPTDSLIPRLQAITGSNPDALLYVRDTIFDDGKRTPTPRYRRVSLLDGDVVTGPALIVQHNSTTLLPSGYHATVLSHGDMRIVRA